MFLSMIMFVYVFLWVLFLCLFASGFVFFTCVWMFM